MNDVIQSGLKWNVFSGITTKFWKDRWLDDDPLMQPNPICPLVGHEEHSVCFYWKQGNGWDWDLLTLTLTNTNLLKLATLGLSPKPHEENRLSWAHTANGIYSVSSGYKGPDRRCQNEAGNRVGLAWKPEVPEKIRCFIWMTIIRGRSSPTVSTIGGTCVRMPLVGCVELRRRPSYTSLGSAKNQAGLDLDNSTDTCLKFLQLGFAGVTSNEPHG
ncbi:hypothetical protein V2J09_003852 [Rumex salicifolius]